MASDFVLTVDHTTSGYKESRMSHMQFELLGTQGQARRGRLQFPRGTVQTPAFMPVGTYGTVKP